MNPNQAKLMRLVSASGEFAVTHGNHKQTARHLFRLGWLKLSDPDNWVVTLTPAGEAELAGDDAPIWVAALGEAAKIADGIETQQEADNGAANTGGAAAAAAAIRAFAKNHFD